MKLASGKDIKHFLLLCFLFVSTVFLFITARQPGGKVAMALNKMSGNSDGLRGATDQASDIKTTYRASNSPNVFLIVMDDMGWNDIGYQSSDLGSFTPTLDSLAEDGIKLNNHYAMPVCTPTRAALLTGRHPVQLGMQHWQIMPSQPWGLSTTETILPQYLKTDHSYETHIVGKWHLGHYKPSMLPMKRGFDTFTGFLGGGEDYVTKLSQDSCIYNESGEKLCAYDFRSEGGRYEVKDGEEDFNTYILGNKATEIMYNHSASNSGNPLFMYLPLPNPHAPVTKAPNMEDREDLLKSIPNPYRRDYASLILALDDTVSNIIKVAKETGLYDNSYFIFLSDNGADVPSGGNNYPLRGAKNTLFEGGVRTPAFIHSPLLSSESRGTTFEGLFHVSDWLPTIMGGMLNSNIDSRSEAKEWYGINQWDAMTSSSNDADMGSTSTFPRTELLLNIDYLDSEGHVNDGIKVGLIKDNYKLIMNEVSVDWFPVPEDETEVVEERLKPANFLFNLKEDPTEAINLVGKQRDIMKDLRVQMKTYMDTLLQPSNFRPDDSASAWTAWQRNDESDHPLLGPWLSDDVSEGLLTSNVLKNYPDRWHFETDMILDKKSASSTIMNEEGEMISKDDA